MLLADDQWVVLFEQFLTGRREIVSTFMIFGNTVHFTVCVSAFALETIYSSLLFAMEALAGVFLLIFLLDSRF